MILFTSTYR